ncbi:MAG: hypothetical protein EZS28_031351 [Streblomastix strix]|uniref:Uncharacterized protein n=1 Tax=Streblomastix strix TaxID=222440 RepID=A0A5J4URZ5_9EUKA|nr:MAG: hypothetical protein EZS28_031351 [Streblomastix strix]
MTINKAVRVTPAQQTPLTLVLGSVLNSSVPFYGHLHIPSFLGSFTCSSAVTGHGQFSFGISVKLIGHQQLTECSSLEHGLYAIAFAGNVSAYANVYMPTWFISQKIK